MQLHNKLAIQLVLTLIFACIFTLVSKGQSSDSKMHFGVFAGGNTTTTFPINNIGWKYDKHFTYAGFIGGANFRYDISKNFFMHLELNVSTHNSHAEGFTTDTGFNNFTFDGKYTNIGVPIGIGAWFLPNTTPFNIGMFACAQPYFSKEKNTPIIKKGKYDIDGGLYDIGISALVGMDFRYEFVVLSLRYSFDATPIAKIEEQKIHTGVFSFVLCFYFF